MSRQHPDILSVPDFSEYIGCKRNYAYQLKKEGRLVLTDDGKRVKVAESLARIEATRDPSKRGVSDRHAAARGTPVLTGHAAAPHAEEASEPDPMDGDAQPAAGVYHYQDAKAKREHWAAEREHAAYRKEAGELMERSAVVAAFADAGSTLRSRLEAWSVQLPPQLAGLDEPAVRALIAEQVERVLHDLVERFARMAGEPEHG